MIRGSGYHSFVATAYAVGRSIRDRQKSILSIRLMTCGPPSSTMLTFFAKALFAAKKLARLCFLGDQFSLTFTFGLFFFLVFSFCCSLFQSFFRSTSSLNG